MLSKVQIITSLSYNTRNNSLPSNDERSYLSCKTSDQTINIKKILFRFDNLDNELLNVKTLDLKDL